MKLRVKPSIVRAVILVILILLQVIIMARTIWMTSQVSQIIDWSLLLISFLVVLYLVKANTDPSYKLMWIILILLAPVFGGLFYVFFGIQPSARRLRRDMNRIQKTSKLLFKQNDNYLKQIFSMRDDFGRQATYLSQTAGFPVYGASKTEYFSSGEEKFEKLKSELHKAKHFIFLEYFIIEEGLMWDEILSILAEKAKAGLDVRVMYDDIGCLFTLPTDYYKELAKLGIKCTAFNPSIAFPSTLLNNRDHRKLLIIDGVVAFTGGVNLADEYINKRDKYGHWKDAAVLILGEAVKSLTIMFLEMWTLQTKTVDDYTKFLLPQDSNYDEYVQPYADNPLDSENVGASVYLNIINTAREYVYITTPYLILDHSMLSALCLAAKSGIDVRIITPRHWDKWIAHMTTRSYYNDLVSNGVKVYEYVDGFMHAKTFVSDDAIAVVGTINLDYRSLYLHYECGAILYGGQAVDAVKDDYMHTLERCDEVKLGEYEPKNFVTSIGLKILRLFAPLL